MQGMKNYSSAILYCSTQPPKSELHGAQTPLINGVTGTRFPQIKHRHLIPFQIPTLLSSEALQLLSFFHSSMLLRRSRFKEPTTNSNKVQPRCKNVTPTGRFAQKTQTSQKENLPRESKPQLDNTHNRVDQNHQNALFDATTLTINLIELCEEGKLAEALELMGQGSVADYGIFLAMLNLCEGTRLLEYGKRVHEFLRRSRFRGEVELNNRLIGMYEKCSNMNIARKVFDRIERNVSSWHLMIIGYTENGAVVSGLSGGEKRGRRRERGAAVWVVAVGCGEGRWLWRC
ncbi:hypothetical protein S83_026404 [Arachis hypogaea]|uniref:Pentatricopeptide repeat-containing protein n=1 Tax=Arachis hypogaea TaxID=3818 RepID=A0A445BYR7_ARAHY|nr:hypothetical protein Ahy_A08g040275 isoform B [Arachis hypogaea]